MVTLDAPTGYVRLFKAMYKNIELPGIVPDTNPNPIKTMVVTGNNNSYTAQLPDIPVIKGTVKIYDSTASNIIIAQDDREGKIVGKQNGVTIFGVVDYRTGALSFVSSGTLTITGDLTVSY